MRRPGYRAFAVSCSGILRSSTAKIDLWRVAYGCSSRYKLRWDATLLWPFNQYYKQWDFIL